MPYKIQHLGLGGILDQAIAITKDHFGMLFGIMLILLIPYNLITGLITVSLLPETSFFPTAEDAMEMQAAQLRHWPIFVIFPIIGGFVILPLTNASVIWAVAQVYLGQPVTAWEAVKQGFRRLLPLLGTSILMYLAIMGGMILCILPGILFAIWFGLSQHVVMIEGIAGPRALGRSRKLVSRDWATLLALGVIILVITAAIGGGTALIPQRHVQIVAQTLAQSVTTIIATAAGVVFYFSVRCALENFDLHYLAESIGAAPPAVDDEASAARS